MGELFVDSGENAELLLNLLTLLLVEEDLYGLWLFLVVDWESWIVEKWH